MLCASRWCRRPASYQRIMDNALNLTRRRIYTHNAKNDNGDGVRQLNHLRLRIDDPYFERIEVGVFYFDEIGRSMLPIVLVGVGSFIGGVLRYSLSTWGYRVLDNPWFPYGTLAVNGLGCLGIGFFAGMAESPVGVTSGTPLLIFVWNPCRVTTVSSLSLR